MSPHQPIPAGHQGIDVAALPDQGEFGHHGLIWWGTAAFMVIEGSMFLMVLITYYYLRLRVEEWPPSLPDPYLGWGIWSLALALISVVPNHLEKLAAERFDLRKVRVWLIVCTVLGIGLLVLRGFEFAGSNCRWDDNAYGSMVWALLVLHTTHLATEVTDTAVLMVLMFVRPPAKRRYIDVSENGLYWYFVVLWWIPVFVTIYLAPRWL